MYASRIRRTVVRAGVVRTGRRIRRTRPSVRRGPVTVAGTRR